MPASTGPELDATPEPSAGRDGPRPAAPPWRPLHGLRWRLLPGHCVLCGLPSRRARDLCAACAPLLEPVPRPCSRCALPGIAPGSASPSSPCACADGGHPWPVPRTVAPLAYRGATATLLREFKDRADRGAGRVLLDPLLGALGDLVPELPAGTVLVPIPQTRLRTLERAFDPVRWLAGEIGASLGLPVRRGWVTRRGGASQRGLGRRSRWANLRGAYRCTPRAPRHGSGATVLLVDDVITTGATLGAVAAAVRAAGATPVGACALARTPEGPTGVGPGALRPTGFL